MKNTTPYILNNTFNNSFLKNKVTVSLSIMCLFVLTTVFSSYKIEAEPFNENLLKSNTQKNITASITYRTVHPFKEKQAILLNSKHSYAIFSPVTRTIENQTVNNFSSESNKPSFYQASFFEKAMRFNDTLQTWVN